MTEPLWMSEHLCTEESGKVVTALLEESEREVEKEKKGKEMIGERKEEDEREERGERREGDEEVGKKRRGQGEDGKQQVDKKTSQQ